MRKNILLHNPAYGIEFVLKELDGKQYQNDKTNNRGIIKQIVSILTLEKFLVKCTIDTGFLKDAYGLFLRTYGQFDKTVNKHSGFLGKHLKSKINFDQIREEIYSLLPANLGKNLCWTPQLKKTIIPKLVGNIFGTWTVQNS
jgi:hypothetical protein